VDGQIDGGEFGVLGSLGGSSESLGGELVEAETSDRKIADSVYPFFGIAGFPNQQQILGDRRRCEMLRRHDHSGVRSTFEEPRELHRHGALVVSDEDPSIASRCFENVGILEAPQAGVRRGPKLNRRLEAKNGSENDVV
jgi:hypothetical protein